MDLRVPTVLPKVPEESGAVTNVKESGGERGANLFEELDELMSDAGGIEEKESKPSSSSSSFGAEIGGEGNKKRKLEKVKQEKRCSSCSNCRLVLILL